MATPEADQSYTIARLNQKINADQVEMAKMLEDAQLMQAALERKKVSEQLAAWAIDRAIETVKLDTAKAATKEDVTAFDDAVIAIATKYTNWIATFKQEPITEQQTVN